MVTDRVEIERLRPEELPEQRPSPVRAAVRAFYLSTFNSSVVPDLRPTDLNRTIGVLGLAEEMYAEQRGSETVLRRVTPGDAPGDEEDFDAYGQPAEVGLLAGIRESAATVAAGLAAESGWQSKPTIAVPEAAALLGISDRTLYNEAQTGGSLEHLVVRVGSRVLVKTSELARLLDAGGQS